MRLIKPEHRAEIDWLSRKAESEEVRIRARIVLLSDRGGDVQTVADELGLGRDVVSDCVSRFAAEGMKVVLADVEEPALQELYDRVVGRMQQALHELTRRS